MPFVDFFFEMAHIVACKIACLDLDMLRGSCKSNTFQINQYTLTLGGNGEQIFILAVLLGEQFWNIVNGEFNWERDCFLDNLFIFVKEGLGSSSLNDKFIKGMT